MNKETFYLWVLAITIATAMLVGLTIWTMTISLWVGVTMGLFDIIVITVALRDKIKEIENDRNKNK